MPLWLKKLAHCPKKLSRWLKKIFQSQGRTSLADYRRQLIEVKKHSQECEEQYHLLQRDYDRLRAENRSFLQELESLQEAHRLLKIRYQQLEVDYQELDEHYQCLQALEIIYQRLSPESQQAIQHLSPQKKGFGLFASLLLNYDAFWDYARYLNQEHQDEDFQAIYSLLNIVFPYYIEVKGLKAQTVKIGEPFDPQKHIRDNRSSSQSGKVSEIILIGYQKKDRIIKPSIVKVE